MPVLAIPITNEQPGIAARLAWSGAGRVLPLKRLRVESLRALVLELLEDPSVRSNALRLQADCQAAGGVKAAADWIEGLDR
ncbi:MAG: hypothetical protein ACKOPS_20900 [Cyanobium sp.]